MINCVIVDDDPMAMEALEYLLNKLEDIEVSTTYNSALDAMPKLENSDIDLVFLDVEMPDFTGIELLETAKILPNIILTTQNEQYAVKALAHKVLDHLTKPIRFARLAQAIDRFKELNNPEKTESTSESREDFFVRSDGRYVRIAFEELLFVETVDDYLALHLDKKGKHLVHSTLKKMEGELPVSMFQKVHRSYIVNLKRIVDFDESSLVINRNVIPVSRAFRPILRERLGLEE